MWFRCRVPGCNKVWQAHDTSSSEYLGVCAKHKGANIPPPKPLGREPVKLFKDAYSLPMQRTPLWITKLRQSSLTTHHIRDTAVAS